MKQTHRATRTIKAMALAIVAAGVFFSTQAFACGIEGKAKRTDGSEVNGTATVSAGGKQATPRNGRYTLDLGSWACGETVEVFVNGYSIGKYTIPQNGNATVNITLEGSSDRPVR